MAKFSRSWVVENYDREILASFGAGEENEQRALAHCRSLYRDGDAVGRYTIRLALVDPQGRFV